MSRRPRLLAILAAGALAAGASATGCGGSGNESGPRPLTGDQADLLAGARFNNYNEGGAHVRADVPLPDGSTAALTGDVDWRRHLGKAGLTTTGGHRTDLVWSPAKVWVQSSGMAPVIRKPDPEASPLDRALVLILQLAATRPENPQLLIQNQAAWIRADQVGGRHVQVFRGPAAKRGDREIAAGRQRTYYWVDADGTLRRFEAHFTEGKPFVVDLDPAHYRKP